MVRYGVGYFNAGKEAENQGNPTPNAPYAKFTNLICFRFPIPDSRFPIPCSRFPIPCSLFI
ncbi:hypothetical protein BJP36_42195 [Moorena producens JHB]|uniref:Uncharacterized protein n=1 Tax=Moorena producens (strain JHB) TaxID=1454205 RepID=A0A9Q9UVM1_MOOP1|nr:hypothetical protein [Moorena producens]WAN68973.1 hypothetical protein BJP36_42195 [Moorena producens JHB]